MKYLFLFLCLFNFSWGLEIPSIGTYRVVDQAHLFSSQEIEELNSLLAQHEKNTTNQIVVLTIKSLEGEVLEEFSLKVAEKWKLGQKGKDNGAILLISQNDRKMRIEVGYGLEGNLSDIITFRIIQNTLKPAFKSGNYFNGVKTAISQMIQILELKTLPEELQQSRSKHSNLSDAPLQTRIVIGFFVLFVLSIFTFFVIMIPTRQGWFLYLFLIPFWGIFPSAVISSVIGMPLLITYLILTPILRLIMPRTNFYKEFQSNISYSNSRVGRGHVWTSGGSGWGGGGFGGSGGGGGFSGGGGGSFGGGGSSGSW